MRRWRVRVYFPSGRSIGLEVDRDKGEMRRRLRRLRAGTPRAWGYRFAVERVPASCERATQRRGEDR